MGRHRFEAAVDFWPLYGSGGDGPLGDVVVEDTFVKLVEDIGGKTHEDIAVWEVPPERVNKADPLFCECRWFESLRNAVDQLKCLGRVSKRGKNTLAKILHRNETLWASVLHAAGDQALLRMVGNVGSKDGKNATHIPIGANHINALLPCFNHGSQNVPHAVME